MHAVLIATQKLPRMELLAERHPSSLLPLIDRPFIQHVLEYLVRQGFKRFEVVLSHLPEKIEALLGDGKRWGIHVRYHLVPVAATPYRPLKSLIGLQGDSPLLLAHADRLVLGDIARSRPASPSEGPALFFARKASGSAEAAPEDWTGWGWLPGKCLAGIRDDFDENALYRYLVENCGVGSKKVSVPAPLGVRSCEELVSSHRRVLKTNSYGLMFGGKEVAPGIWLSRNVSLHPTVELIPPVYIAEDCRIARGAHIGPDAVIGRNCVLGEKSTVSGTVVFPGTYAGDALELRDAVVDRNCLINIRIGSEILIKEDFILGNLEAVDFRRGWRRLAARMFAGLLLIPAVPVIACAALYGRFFRGGPVFTTRQVVRLPTEPEPASWKNFRMVALTARPAACGMPEPGACPSGTDRLPAGWRHLLFFFLPGLINVARGELGFVGVPPRTAAQILALPPDWRALYLKSKAGMVTECLVRFGPWATEDDRYAADAVYAVSTTLIYDVKLMIRYIGQILGHRRPPAAPAGPGEST